MNHVGIIGIGMNAWPFWNCHTETAPSLHFPALPSPHNNSAAASINSHKEEKGQKGLPVWGGALTQESGETDKVPRASRRQTPMPLKQWCLSVRARLHLPPRVGLAPWLGIRKLAEDGGEQHRNEGEEEHEDASPAAGRGLPVDREWIGVIPGKHSVGGAQKAEQAVPSREKGSPLTQSPSSR